MVVFHYKSFSTTTSVSFNLYACTILINKLCKISCLQWKIRSHMRIQLSSFSWNIRATVGLNCRVATTGCWAREGGGAASRGEGSSYLVRDTHAGTGCSLPYKLMSWRPLVYNITSRFTYAEMTENILNILIYIL